MFGLAEYVHMIERGWSFRVKMGPTARGYRVTGYEWTCADPYEIRWSNYYWFMTAP